MTRENLVGLNVIDDEGYQRYRDEMTPILERYGGGFRYDFKVARVLKAVTDEPINRVFLIYFADEAARHAFFSNEDYVNIKRKHFDKSVGHTTIISTYDRDD